MTDNNNGGPDENRPLMDNLDKATAPILTYQEALRETIIFNEGDERKGQSVRGSLFQILIIVVTQAALNSSGFIIFGLPFMKGEPKVYYCIDHETGNYNTCNKQYICENGLNRDAGEYRPETEDYFYIDNWQNQADIICESKSRIGFIGACFFIGVLCGSTIIPLGFLSDIVGRKWIFVGSITVLMAACFGFLFATTIEELYIYMFLYGITFPGRLIVGQNYAYEFLTPAWQDYYQPIGQYVQGICCIVVAFYFQVCSKNLRLFEIINICILGFLLILTIIMFPESPRWQYSKERYLQSREGLQTVADTNGQANFDKNGFIFDAEQDTQDAQTIDDQKNKIDGGNLYNISTGRFISNVVIYSLLLSCFSFCFWLADFQAEYIGADVYIIFYINGACLIVCGVINQVLYPILGMKWLIIIFQCGTIFACLFITLIHTKVIGYEDEAEQATFFQASMLILITILSLSIQVGFTATFQSMFQDERVFPFAKKGLAINIIVLVSKSFTIGAPFANELEEPIPIVMMMGLAVLSIIIVLFTKSKAELDAMEKTQSLKQQSIQGSNKEKRV